MRISPKIIKIILISFLAGIVMIYGILYGVFQSNRHKIDEAFQAGLEEVINGKITKSDVRFSILNSFPYPTVHMQFLHVEDEQSGEPVKVLDCSGLDLQFSIMALLKKNLVINSVTIKSLQISEARNKLGFTSKLRFISRRDSSVQEAKKILIPRFKIKQFSFERFDDSNGNEIKLSEAEIIGNLKTEDNGDRTIQLSATGDFNHFKSSFRKIVDQASFTVDGKITILRNVPGVNFQSNKLLVEGYPLQLEGLIRNVNDTSQYRELYITGRDTTVKLLLFFLPDSLKSMLVPAKDMQSSISLSFSGLQSQHLQPHLKITAQVANAHIQTPDKSLSLNKINVIQKLTERGNGLNRSMEVYAKLSADALIKYLDIEQPHPILIQFIEKFQNPNSDIVKERTNNDVYNVSMRMNLQADSIKYLDAYIKDLKGLVSLDSSVVGFKDFSGKIAHGFFHLDADLLPEGYLNTTIKVSKVNLRELMKSFRNFNQGFVLSQHITGNASFDLKASSQLTSKNVPQFYKTHASGILKLHALSFVDWPVAVEVLNPFIGKASEHLKSGETTLAFSMKSGQLAIPVFTLQSNIGELKVGMHSEGGAEYLLFKLNVLDQMKNLGKGNDEPMRKNKDRRLDKKRITDIHAEIVLKEGKFVEKTMLKRQSFETREIQLKNRWNRLKN